MRVALFSDIHGNISGLKVVLAQIDATAVLMSSSQQGTSWAAVRGHGMSSICCGSDKSCWCAAMRKTAITAKSGPCSVSLPNGSRSGRPPLPGCVRTSPQTRWTIWPPCP